MKWIDISMPLQDNMAVWPGDTPFCFSLNWTKQETGSVNVGRIEMSTHTGTHIDAPFHFDNEGSKVIELDIDRYIGKALVLDMTNKEFICEEDVESLEINGINIILFKTKVWKDRTQFPTEIPYIKAGVAKSLSHKGIKLIGVDLPSVDPLDSKELVAHHELVTHDIHILEGIVLDEINEGLYELIAVPLPISKGDASPVRALIRTL
jgi:arylformamidase